MKDSDKGHLGVEVLFKNGKTFSYWSTSVAGQNILYKDFSDADNVKSVKKVTRKLNENK